MNSSPLDITAVVMAGGKGSRIGDLGQGKPKCLLPVGHQTILTRLIGQLRDAGIRQTTVCSSPQNVHAISEFLEEDLARSETAASAVKPVLCSDCHLGPLPALAEVLSSVSAEWILMCLADIYFTGSPLRLLRDGLPVDLADGWLMIGTDEMLRDGGGTGFVTRDGSAVQAISYKPTPETGKANHDPLRWSGSFLFRSELALHLRENLSSYAGVPFESWIQGLLTSGVRCSWIDVGGFVNVNAIADYQYLVSKCGAGDPNRQIDAARERE